MADRDLVLVTGGAGFVGSHTVDLLLKRDYRVRILDNFQPRVHPHGAPSWVAKDAEVIQGDVANREDLRRGLEGVDYVFHLAAYQDYLPEFSRFVHDNAESAGLIFELIVSDAKRFPVRKIVFASSQAVGGEGPYICSTCNGGARVPTIQEQLREGTTLDAFSRWLVKFPEPRPLWQLERGDWDIHCPSCLGVMEPLLMDEQTASPGTAYGISKHVVELFAERLGRRYAIPTVCMRYSYVQGSRNSPYNVYSGAARRFAVQLLQGSPPVVYEDGRQLRDYVNVHDVARANLLVLEDERANYQVFNVGGGRGVTVLELAYMMLREFGKALEPSIPGEFRVGDTRHTVSDISKLRAIGWEPSVPVEENIREYVSWVKDQCGTYEYLEEAERVMRGYKVVRSTVCGGPGKGPIN